MLSVDCLLKTNFFLFEYFNYRMEYNCFTVVSAVQQSESAKCTHTLPPPWASSHARHPHSPSRPSRASQLWAELPVRHSSFCVTRGRVCMSVLLSQKHPCVCMISWTWSGGHVRHWPLRGIVGPLTVPHWDLLSLRALVFNTVYLLFFKLWPCHFILPLWANLVFSGMIE